MSSTMYVKYALTGGTVDALDSIGYAGLTDTDFCIVFDVGASACYVYKYSMTEASGESSPDYIIPDDNASGTGAWVMQEIYATGGGTGPGGYSGTLYDANDIGIATVASGAISAIIDPPVLLLEDGGKLLQENGREIFDESA